MFVQPPDGIVGRTKLNFRIGNIKLENNGLDVVLTSHPGMLQGKSQEDLVGKPDKLQIGGEAVKGLIDESIQEPHLGRLSQPSKLDNIVILLDTSTSMREKKLSLIKEQVDKLGPFIPEGTKVTVIQFNKDTRVVANAVTINNPHDFTKKVVTPIGKLEVNHGTNILKALIDGSNHIASLNGYNHEHPERNLVILITDGDYALRGENNEIRYPTKLQYENLYDLCTGITSLRNAPLVVVGIGTNYNLDNIEKMAGFSGGAWAHTTKDTSKVDVFGKFIPDLIKQITGNELYLRCDAYSASRIWSIAPSIQELAFRAERFGIEGHEGLHELRGGYWDDPTFISIFSPEVEADVKYYLAGQDDAKLHPGRPEEFVTPYDFGFELPILSIDDLQVELKAKAQDAITKWLKTLSIHKRDLGAMFALRKAELIGQDEYENLIGAMHKNNEDELRSAETGVSLNPHRSIGPEISRIRSEQESKSFDPDFEKKLNDLSKVDIPNYLRPNLPNVPKPGSMVEPSLHLHSGGLGRIDEPPKVTDLPVFSGPQPGAAANYDKVPTQRVKIEIVPIKGKIVIKNASLLSKLNPIKIGRQRDNDIEIQCPRASKYHCQIIHKENKYFICDSNSTNGTYVNGEKIAKQELKDDDLIHIGTAAFKVSIGRSVT